MSEDPKRKKDWPSVGAHYLSRSESAVLIAVGAVLVVVALFLLANSVIQVGHDVDSFLHVGGHGKPASDIAVEILNSVLLVMMTMEIVYTVAVSLESHTLVAEPFLIIGAIAAIRRMLVITATSTGEVKIDDLIDHAMVKQKLDLVQATEYAQLRTQIDAAKFKSTLLELALLAATVIALAFAVWILKKAHAVRESPPNKLPDGAGGGGAGQPHR